VCTGNTCRSAMAEALARRALEELFPERRDIEFASGGLAALPGAEATPESVAALREKGVVLEGHRASLVTPGDIEQAALVLTMTSAHREALLREVPEAAGKIFTLAEYAGSGSDIADPLGRGMEAYRTVAEELQSLVCEALRRFVAEGEQDAG